MALSKTAMFSGFLQVTFFTHQKIILVATLKYNRWTRINIRQLFHLIIYDKSSNWSLSRW